MLNNLLKVISTKIPFRVSYIDLKRSINRQYLIYILISICIQIFLHYNSYVFYNKITDADCVCGINDDELKYIYSYSIFKIYLMIFLIITYILIYNKQYSYIGYYDKFLKLLLFIDIGFLIYWTYNVYIYYNNIRDSCECVKNYNLDVMYYYSIIVISAITLGFLTYGQNLLLTKSSEFLDYGLSQTYDKVVRK